MSDHPDSKLEIIFEALFIAGVIILVLMMPAEVI